jgi:hypothetical protein
MCEVYFLAMERGYNIQLVFLWQEPKLLKKYLELAEEIYKMYL